MQQYWSIAVVDNYTPKPGSDPDLIERCLSHQGKTAEQISKESGVTVKRVLAHLNWHMKNRGRIKVEER